MQPESSTMRNAQKEQYNQFSQRTRPKALERFTRRAAQKIPDVANTGTTKTVIPETANTGTITNVKPVMTNTGTMTNVEKVSDVATTTKKAPSILNYMKEAITSLAPTQKSIPASEPVPVPLSTTSLLFNMVEKGAEGVIPPTYGLNIFGIRYTFRQMKGASNISSTALLYNIDSIFTHFNIPKDTSYSADLCQFLEVFIPLFGVNSFGFTAKPPVNYETYVIPKDVKDVDYVIEKLTLLNKMLNEKALLVGNVTNHVKDWNRISSKRLNDYIAFLRAQRTNETTPRVPRHGLLDCSPKGIEGMLAKARTEAETQTNIQGSTTGVVSGVAPESLNGVKRLLKALLVRGQVERGTNLNVTLDAYMADTMTDEQKMAMSMLLAQLKECPEGCKAKYSEEDMERLRSQITALEAQAGSEGLKSALNSLKETLPTVKPEEVNSAGLSARMAGLEAALEELKTARAASDAAVAEIQAKIEGADDSALGEDGNDRTAQILEASTPLIEAEIKRLVAEKVAEQVATSTVSAMNDNRLPYLLETYSKQVKPPTSKTSLPSQNITPAEVAEAVSNSLEPVITYMNNPLRKQPASKEVIDATLAPAIETTQQKLINELKAKFAELPKTKTNTALAVSATAAVTEATADLEAGLRSQIQAHPVTEEQLRNQIIPIVQEMETRIREDIRQIPSTDPATIGRLVREAIDKELLETNAEFDAVTTELSKTQNQGDLTKKLTQTIESDFGPRLEGLADEIQGAVARISTLEADTAELKETKLNKEEFQRAMEAISAPAMVNVAPEVETVEEAGANAVVESVPAAEVSEPEPEPEPSSASTSASASTPTSAESTTTLPTIYASEGQVGGTTIANVIDMIYNDASKSIGEETSDVITRLFRTTGFLANIEQYIITLRTYNFNNIRKEGNTPTNFGELIDYISTTAAVSTQYNANIGKNFSEIIYSIYFILYEYTNIVDADGNSLEGNDKAHAIINTIMDILGSNPTGINGVFFLKKSLSNEALQRKLIAKPNRDITNDDIIELFNYNITNGTIIHGTLILEKMVSNEIKPPMSKLIPINEPRMIYGRNVFVEEEIVDGKRKLVPYYTIGGDKKRAIPRRQAGGGTHNIFELLAKAQLGGSEEVAAILEQDGGLRAVAHFMNELMSIA